MGTLSWKPFNVCDEALCCGSRFQRVMVLGKKLLFHCIAAVVIVIVIVIFILQQHENIYKHNYSN